MILDLPVCRPVVILEYMFQSLIMIAQNMLDNDPGVLCKFVCQYNPTEWSVFEASALFVVLNW